MKCTPYSLCLSIELSASILIENYYIFFIKLTNLLKVDKKLSIVQTENVTDFEVYKFVK